MDINRILNFASTAGKIMLQSGGETYRVEETITRICQSFDVDSVDVFASPTAVMVSIIFDGKIYSLVKRINSRSIDLNMVHNINSLSRTIYSNKPDIEFCEKELEKLRDKISSSSEMSDVVFLTGSTFQLALKAKTGDGKAQKAYNQINKIINNYFGYDDEEEIYEIQGKDNK